MVSCDSLQSISGLSLPVDPFVNGARRHCWDTWCMCMWTIGCCSEDSAALSVRSPSGISLDKKSWNLRIATDGSGLGSGAWNTVEAVPPQELTSEIGDVWPQEVAPRHG